MIERTLPALRSAACLAFPLLAVGLLAASDIHVYPGGSMSAIGSALERARNLPPGTPRRILVHGGKYLLKEPIRLGSGDSGLTVEAAPGEKPELFGGRPVRGWKRDGRFWFVDLRGVASGKWDFRMLSVNGRFAQRARLPAKGAFEHATEFPVRWMGTNGGGWKRKPTERELTTLEYKPGDLPESLQVRNAEVTVYHMWDESMVTIKSHDPVSRTLSFASPAGHPPGAFGVRKYVVWNVREGMTEPGQWYLDRVAGRLVYWPLPGEDMRKAFVVAPTTTSIIRIEGKSDSPVRGIALRGLALSVTNTPPVAGGFGAGRYDGAVHLDWAEDVRLEDLVVSNTGGQGVKATNAARLFVSNNEIHSTGACGIVARGPDIEISGNHVHHVGIAYPSAIGVLASGARLRIRHNEVHDTPYTAVNFGGTGGLVESNLIRRAMLELHDGAAFYVIFGRDMIVRGNLVRDLPDTGGYGSSAYYLDELSENCLVESNVSVNVERPSHNHIGRRNTIRNNVFISSGRMRLTFPHSAGYTFEKNVLSAGGGILFSMPPDAIASMRGNLFHSGENRLLCEIIEQDGAKPRQPLQLRDGSIAAEPAILEPSPGLFTFAVNSPAHQLGIQPVDVSKAGRQAARERSRN